MKKSLYAFLGQSHFRTNQPVAQSDPEHEQMTNKGLSVARAWLVEGLLAAAFGGAIYFLS